MNDEQKPTAKRRPIRWLTLAELLGVGAVVISGLTFWDAHTDRVREQQEQAETRRKNAARTATLVLRGTPARDGASMAIAPLRDDQTIQTQTIMFPSALKLAPVETTGDPRIEAGWFSDELKRARKALGDDDSSKGDERLPVLITTRYLAEGDPAEDRALYDLGFAVDERFLGGARVRIRGLSLVSRVHRDGTAARLEARWKRLHPQHPRPTQ